MDNPDTTYDDTIDDDTRDWRWEVGNGDTVLGLAEWLEHRAEAEAHDNDEGA